MCENIPLNRDKLALGSEFANLSTKMAHLSPGHFIPKMAHYILYSVKWPKMAHLPQSLTLIFLWHYIRAMGFCLLALLNSTSRGSLCQHQHVMEGWVRLGSCLSPPFCDHLPKLAFLMKMVWENSLGSAFLNLPLSNILSSYPNSNAQGSLGSWKFTRGTP